MKKIGLFMLIVAILAACGPSENAVDIAQAQSVIEAARAAQDASRAAQIAAQGSISDVGRGQTLILVLLTLLVVVILCITVYLVVRRLIRIQLAYRKLTSGKWISGPNAHWRKAEEPDLYQQMLLEQQWLLTQLLSQGHEDADAGAHDLMDLPHDWWS